MLSPNERAQNSTAGLLLRRAGAKTKFQLYALTPNLDAGSEALVVSGAPVLAAMVKDMETRKRGGDLSTGSRPVRTKVEVYHVEIPAFAAFGGLTEDWKPTVDGKERAIEELIMADDDTFYVVRLTTGGD